MGTKMKKGILRPFRYISNMMDNKEPEMAIGFPTDVKHVAHIGWDGPSAATTNNSASAPTWMKDYHSAPLDSASFRSDKGGTATAASNPWASQEIVMDGGSLGDTSFRDTRSEAGGTDIAAGDSPPSPGTRRSRRNRSRGSATSSMDVTGGDAATEKKDKAKKGTRKNRKKDKDKASAGDDAAAGGSATCQDLPAVPKKSNRRKTKGSAEGSTADVAAKDAAAGAGPDDGAAAPPSAVTED